MAVHLTQRNQIADTGVVISPLGLGTVKLGRNRAVKYPHDFKIPDDRQVLELLSRAWDYGINLIDTAPAYGSSEVRLGGLLPKLNRDWVIATKVGETFNNINGDSNHDFTQEFITTSIEKSLIRLKVDVLDIVLIHSNGDDTQLIKEGALDVLDDLKRKGAIRAIGISTKTVDGGLLALKHSDVVMLMHNLEYINEQKVIEQASKDNKGIFIKKLFSSGNLINNKYMDSVQDSFNFIFQQPAVSSVIIGTINTSHLRDNVVKAITALEKNNITSSGI